VVPFVTGQSVSLTGSLSDLVPSTSRCELAVERSGRQSVAYQGVGIAPNCDGISTIARGFASNETSGGTRPSVESGRLNCDAQRSVGVPLSEIVPAVSKYRANQSAAVPATCSKAPGSSNR